LPVAVYEIDASEVESFKKFLEYDPYLDKALSEEELKKLNSDKLANIIFARQEYSLRDGRALGMEDGKYYLYLKANDEFLALAQEKLLKSFKSIKRASKVAEEKFNAIIKEEEDRANAGVGAIFGG
jgi:hypothetical protein